nr:PREDICTED: uncharacterized protein LOC103994168 isoform X3 [Musa acuminata subsp. malaccensis]
MQDFKRKKVFAMGLSKTEIDLIRLLEAASRQQNQTKLVHNRKLQEDLTDDMVGLARQLKESSLLMVQSLQDTEKSFLQWITPEVFNFRYCNHSFRFFGRSLLEYRSACW